MTSSTGKELFHLRHGDSEARASSEAAELGLEPGGLQQNEILCCTLPLGQGPLAAPSLGMSAE